MCTCVLSLTNEQVSVRINDHEDDSDEIDERNDAEKVAKILYLLDKFTVSDAAYHEVAQLSHDLPRCHQV